MPGYAGDGQAKVLLDNQQAYLFGTPGGGETIVAGTASFAYQLERRNRTFYPFGASFQLIFSGNPGTFEVDVQTSDIDGNIYYCTINSWNSLTALNSSYVGRIELPSFWAKFVRGYVKTLQNAVTTTLLVTR